MIGLRWRKRKEAVLGTMEHFGISAVTVVGTTPYIRQAYGTARGNGWILLYGIFFKYLL